MNKKLLFVVVILTALALTGSALALAPMGTPTAGLKTGQFRAGVDYSFTQTDVEAEWDGYDETMKDVQSNMVAANLGYGISDDWEVFARLGTANAEFDEVEVDGDTYDYDPAFEGYYGFLFGFGTKYTFYKQESLDWGVLFQMHWLNTKDSWSESGVYPGEGEDPDISWTDKDELEINAYEIQIAAGPNWKVAEGFSVYGGPFFQFIGGDADYDWSEIEDGVVVDSGGESADLKEDSCFGGYVGAQWDFMQNTSLFGEFQFTGAGWTFGTGVGWKF
jgi:hypothetical protein